MTVCVCGVETSGCNVTVFDGRLGEDVGKCGACADQIAAFIQSGTKKRELLKTSTKIEEIQEKKFIDRN